MCFPSPVRPLIAASALALLSAAPAHAQADSLEACSEDDQQFAINLVCATAITFGADAAFLREALRAVGDPTGLRQSRKIGGREWFSLTSLTGQVTSGNFEGQSANLLIGADTAITPMTSVGAMVVLGDGYSEAPFSPRIERTEVLVGPYFAARFAGGGVLNGYLLYGEPDYTIFNTTTRGESVTASMNYSRYIELDGPDLVPFVALSARREEPDGVNTIDARILTLGTSIEGDVVPAGNGFRQLFGRAELDIGSYTDSFGTDISYVAPRIGGGMRYAFESGASLQLVGTVSGASDGTMTTAAQVSYRFEF